MAYKKKTLRTMSPTARKVARLLGELESVAKRLKNLVPELQRLDLDSKALEKAVDPMALGSIGRHLASIESLSQMRYQEIGNPDAINKTLEVIQGHASQALELVR